MTNFTSGIVANFFKIIAFITVLQYSKSATAQNINIPVYKIKSTELRSLLVKGNRSKLMVCLMIDKAGAGLTDSSSLKIFALAKNNLGTRKRVILGQGSAIQHSYNLDTTFYPFIMGNTEIRIKKLRKTLPAESLLDDGYFYFIPSIIDTSMFKGTVRNLIFTISYLSKGEFKNNIINYKAFLRALTKVAELNPCPPARPPDYN